MGSHHNTKQCALLSLVLLSVHPGKILPNSHKLTFKILQQDKISLSKGHRTSLGFILFLMLSKASLHSLQFNTV